MRMRGVHREMYIEKCTCSSFLRGRRKGGRRMLVGGERRVRYCRLAHYHRQIASIVVLRRIHSLCFSKLRPVLI